MVYAPRQARLPAIVAPGCVSALKPEDADLDRFDRARDQVQRLDDPLAMVEEAASFLARVAEFSQDVSRTVDVGLDFGSKRRRYRGPCGEIVAADDLERFNCSP